MSELLTFILDHEEAFRSRGRLSSLYSDFRVQLNTNPDGYYANVSAWKKALSDAARAGVIPARGVSNDLLTIRTGEELSRALASKEWGRPMALGAVIQDAVAKREMIPLKDFLTSKTSIYNRSWNISPWQVISWGLRQLGVLGELGNQEKLAGGNFVVVANVEATANAVLQHMSLRNSKVDLVYSRAAFARGFAHVLNPTRSLSPVDLNVLLMYLARDKHEISFDSKTIKFKATNETIPSPITHQDATIASLRDLISSLNAQLPPLTVRIATLDAEARAAVASKSMTTARSALRSKKLAEATLARRTDTLAQLEDVFSKIEAAADQVEIVRVMEASASVLRGLHKEVGGVEGVEGVVDALKEEMGRVDEVSGIINEVGQEGTVIDEAEVDQEFEALEKAERQKKEKAEKEEREKRENEEAEKTRRRLAELEEQEKEQRRETSEEPVREETSQSLSSMSFEKPENPMSANSGRQQEQRTEKSSELLLA
ncbi:hypothetical protein AOQ84DRAFT_334295 [Glonium stellatum]|uniref:Uncharacterized protein n=1 Tax=Glonium stellatum TaxID=574774 RepID=A0A8E2F8X5_9PEZI|nr:hypothetical protein AOQ84DRAFT_334295 [Glonium stellatum]